MPQPVGLTSHGSTGGGGINDDDGQATGRVFLGHALGEELGALVGPDHVVEAHGRGLGAGPTLPGQSECADARCADDTLDTGTPAARDRRGHGIGLEGVAATTSTPQPSSALRLLAGRARTRTR
jgi:hypothetical protein